MMGQELHVWGQQISCYQLYHPQLHHLQKTGSDHATWYHPQSKDNDCPTIDSIVAQCCCEP